MRVGSGLGVLIGFAVSVFPAHAEEFTVYKRLMEDRKAVTATVESADTLLARARIGGTVGSLETDEGDRVTAGQQLALIGDRKLALQIEGQDARMQSLKATRDNAEVEFRRAEQLFAAGTIPKVRFDTAKTAFEVADRTWAAQRKERDVVAQQSTEGAVLAPGDGRVIKVHVNTGSVVLPGEPIFTIASGAYLLRLRLPERHAQFLQSGQPVQVSPRGEHPAPDEPMREGRVALVYPRMDQGRVVADVTVEGLGDYFVGERTTVYVATGSREAFVVPANFLLQRFGLSYVRLKDGTEVVVQTGQAVTDGIEILSGLKDGDVLVSP
ncbi:MAG: hypothetical protein A2516_10315 [Alphaproteobacteria bacterium RIFOXYD12_FULL_60_8]|nr:MAG: hypothetical protein A2516_10315 [Alphaproteobacteria bacterium RIFOXYD12_FULL_60_8]